MKSMKSMKSTKSIRFKLEGVLNLGCCILDRVIGIVRYSQKVEGGDAVDKDGTSPSTSKSECKSSTEKVADVERIDTAEAGGSDPDKGGEGVSESESKSEGGSGDYDDEDLEVGYDDDGNNCEIDSDSEEYEGYEDYEGGEGEAGVIKNTTSESEVESEPEDFDESVGEIKEFQRGVLEGEGSGSGAKDLLEGVKSLDGDNTDVAINEGHIVNESLVDVGSDTAGIKVSMEGISVKMSGDNIKGIDEIRKLYRGGSKAVEVSGDEKMLLDKLLTIRRRYNEIDIEIKNIRCHGFVEYERFLFECPNLMGVINSVVDWDHEDLSTIPEPRSVQSLKLSPKVMESLVNICYNVLCLDLYMLYEEYLRGLALYVKASKDSKAVDVIIDAATEIRGVWNLIDPSIRKKTQKRAIGIMRNVYTGFDTEFENVNMRYNRLLSVQIAACGELVVRVPVYTPYRLHSINTLSGEKYSRSLKSRYILDGSINVLIDERIKSIRYMKLIDNDIFVIYLSRVLDALTYSGSVKKVDMSDRDYNYYIFEKGGINKWFKVVDNYTLAELVKQSTGMVKADLDVMEQKFNALIRSCISNIEKGEIVYNEDTIKFDTSRIDVPSKLVKKLDSVYTAGKPVSGDEYRERFLLSSQERASELASELHS